MVVNRIAENITHTEHSWVTYDGIPVFGQSWRPDGKIHAVICIVHGLGEHSGRYGHWAIRFCNKGYAAISLDYRGHGKSGGKRGHCQRMYSLTKDAELLLQQSEFMFPFLPKVLYGHSLGGTIVLNYILEKTPLLNAVIVSAPWLRLAFEPKKARLAIGRIMNAVYPGFSQSMGLNPENLSRNEKIIEEYRHDELVHGKITAGMFFEVVKAGQWSLNNSDKVYLPLLLMHGDADRITSHRAGTEFAGRSNRYTTLKIWEGMYHELHNEPDNGKVFDYIIDWLDGIS
ncbi:MAG: lysophospholipase [Bacteroidetes bacterium]|nr:lysophospholipase [Bacteroidota bacterium]